jgi:hypothetical protein
VLTLEEGNLWALESRDGGLDIGPQLEDGEGDIHLSPEQMDKLVAYWQEIKAKNDSNLPSVRKARDV